MNNIKRLSTGVLALVMTGCVSMDGKMVNANGEFHDCSTSGGGIGLGMVVGAALAAANNASCESDAEEKGFLLVDEVGNSGLTVGANELQYTIVQASNPPAYPCVQAGDRLLRIDSIDIASLETAKQALFKESGTAIHVALDRADQNIECDFELN